MMVRVTFGPDDCEDIPVTSIQAAKRWIQRNIREYRRQGFKVTGSYTIGYTVKPGNVHLAIVTEGN